MRRPPDTPSSDDTDAAGDYDSRGIRAALAGLIGLFLVSAIVVTVRAVGEETSSNAALIVALASMLSTVAGFYLARKC
jgi:hypothetical protein